MERLVYRFTLDGLKGGVQKTLQGFETGDILARRLEITIEQNGEVYAVDDSYTATMYVKPEGADETSVNACKIENGKVIYDVLPSDVAMEGMTNMQMVLSHSVGNETDQIVVSPRFKLEVLESDAEQTTLPTTQYTAIEQAVSKANSAYNARIVAIDFDEDGLFHVDYADGTSYENDSLSAYKDTLDSYREQTLAFTMSAQEARDNAIDAQGNAEASATLSQGYANQAQTSEEKAKGYSLSASNSSDSAKEWSDYAEDCKDGAESARDDAEGYRNDAENFRDEAEEYKSLAEDEASNSQDYMRNSEAWATGNMNNAPVPTSHSAYHNNSKYYSEQAKEEVAKVDQKIEDYFTEHHDEFKGDKGDKGDTGAQGERGEKGERGFEGAQGIQGERGERGYDGINGQDGRDGTDGIDGKDGKSAYEYALEGGFVGTEQEFTERIAEKSIVSVEEIQEIHEELDIRVKTPYITNEGETNLTDCDDGYVRDFEAYGKTEQITYNGYNLASEVIYGKYWDMSKPVLVIGSSRLCIKLLSANLPITISSKGKVPSGELAVYARAYKDGVNVKTIGPFGFSQSGYKYTILASHIDVEYDNLGIFFACSDTSVIVSDSMIYDIQVESGSTAHDYEPYVGGIASPNPDYPQEFSGIEELNFEVCGKNVCRRFTDSGARGLYRTFGYAFFPIIEGMTYTLSFDDTVEGNRYYLNENVFRPPAGYEVPITSKVGRNTTQFVFNGKYDKLQLTENGYAFIKNKNDNTASTITNVQIEFGTSATDYKPYSGITRTITPPRTMYKVGDYADILDVENGVWRWNLQNDSLKKTGWADYQKGFANWTDAVTKNPKKTQGSWGNSNYFTKVNGSWSSANNTIALNSSKHAYVTSSKFESASAFMTWLSTTDVELVYILNEEETESINASDLKWLRDIRTTYPTCNIIVTDQNGNLVGDSFLYKLKLETYVKKVAGLIEDDRETIDNIDARLTDEETIGSYAYINSELALALAELEDI